MPERDKEYIKACLKEAIRWIDENDNLPDKKIDMGVWFSDLGTSEILSFVEAPQYAPDYLELEVGDVEPYHMILIPIDVREVAELYDLDD